MIISAVNTVLLNYLQDYEKNTPGYYIENFANRLRKGEYTSLMKSLGVEENDFFNEESYIDYLNATFGENPKDIKIFGGTQEENRFLYELAIEGKTGIEVEVVQHKGETSLDYVTYSIKQINLPFTEMTVTAPQNVTVLANNTPLTDRHLQVETQAIEGFDVLQDQSLIPKLVKYKIGGFINQPTITVKDRQYNVSADNVISVEPDAETKSSLEEFAKEVSVTYAKFVTKDAKFADYTKYLIKESEYYKSIRDFSNYWYVDHSAPEIIGLKAENTHQYSANAFTTEIAFDYKVITTEFSYERIFKTRYRLSIIKDETGYKVVNLLSI